MGKRGLLTILLPYIACLSLLLACLALAQAYLFRKAFAKYEPVVKRGLSVIGKMGKEAQHDIKVTEEVETAVRETGMAFVSERFPELGLFIPHLKENYPDAYAQIEENPGMILSLYKKYAPFLKQIMGRSKGEKGQGVYDY